MARKNDKRKNVNQIFVRVSSLGEQARISSVNVNDAHLPSGSLPLPLVNEEQAQFTHARALTTGTHSHAYPLFLTHAECTHLM